MKGAHRFVIVGDGLAAWMTADALAGTLGPAAGEIRVVLFPCDDASALDATTPGVATLLPGMDMDEERLIAKDVLAFTFGIAFDGWSDREKVFFSRLARSAPRSALRRSISLYSGCGIVIFRYDSLTTRSRRLAHRPGDLPDRPTTSTQSCRQLVTACTWIRPNCANTSKHLRPGEM